MKIGFPRLRPPSFWTTPQGGLPSRLLSPLSNVTAGVSAWRASRMTTAHVDVPVICCGNLTMGGAGKTTLALDLVRVLTAQGYHPHVLSRGYRGSARGPLRVEPGYHSAATVGDEPLLLARVAPTWIGRNRGETARLAVAMGADCLVMDDGLQNLTLHQDLRIVTIDGATGFGNGKLFPAGPLRQLPRQGFAAAGAAVVIGPDRTGVTAQIPGGLPLFHARLIPGPEIRRLQGRRIIAFAGLARPSKFFTTLIDSGVVPLRCLSFPDHHRYTRADCERLARLRREEGVTLVTTAKDAVRLPSWLHEQVTVISVELLWSEPDAPYRLLDLLRSA